MNLSDIMNLTSLNTDILKMKLLELNVLNDDFVFHNKPFWHNEPT